MKVVLRSDVEGVGRRGDIVDVAGGFARNFLLPQGRAIAASEGVTAQAASMRRARDLREARDRESAEAQAKVLSGTTITVSARAGSGGRLFGSVTSSDVAAAIEAQRGVQVDRRHIVLPEPIKVLGNHDVTINLFRDVVAVVTVEVAAAS